MSGTVRSWLHYVDLRNANGTQLEHMSIAKSVRDIIDEQLPTVARAMWD
jgi:thymidylate synthase (FAD)